MRKSFLKALENPQSISESNQIFSMKPLSQQQSFVKIIGSLNLISSKKEVCDIQNILQTYKGSFSSLNLQLKYLQYLMEHKKQPDIISFAILKLLAQWVDIKANLQIKHQLKLFPNIVQSIQKGSIYYEQYLVYICYISSDITKIIKQRKKHDYADLIKFLKTILPKILINLSVPRTFFPQTLINTSEQHITMLYCQQNIQNLLQAKKAYKKLLFTILQTLLQKQLEANQTKQVILSIFDFYYLFNENGESKQVKWLLLEGFRKITSAVRYALHSQMLYFFTILYKLGHQICIKEISNKIEWVADYKKQIPTIGLNKNLFKPYNSQNTLRKQIKVLAGKIQQRYVEILDNFTILYFYFNCLDDSITLRFYYLGPFDKSEPKKILFSTDKKEGLFQGSIQAIEKGIYMFQFDNSYSWLKSKIVSYELNILIPIQVAEVKQNPLKTMIYGKSNKAAKITAKNLKGQVQQNRIKMQAACCKVSQYKDNSFVVYYLGLIRNNGSLYEYETQSKDRFIQKVYDLKQDKNIYWQIQQKKVKSYLNVKQWVYGQYSKMEQQIEIGQDQNDDKKMIENMDNIKNEGDKQ